MGGLAPAGGQWWAPDILSHEGQRSASCRWCQSYSFAQACPSVSCIWAEASIHRQPCFSWGKQGPSGLNGPDLSSAVLLSLPVKSLSHEGNQKQGSGEGQGWIPGAWLGDASHLPVANSWQAWESTFVRLGPWASSLSCWVASDPGALSFFFFFFHLLSGGDTSE